ncbi:hypothetical protein ARMGADRAFT_1086575 [Armillaria gallica]|uniref:Uncharacterized protein n=1 Tax=Armillaria gallica TaxID=47427 RepID=A0A2H3CX53_ARMGA|nr:hypothetical protein ARMGADRAFT_1086575 [Armillaria gallica]
MFHVLCSAGTLLTGSLIRFSIIPEIPSTNILTLTEYSWESVSFPRRCYLSVTPLPSCLRQFSFFDHPFDIICKSPPALLSFPDVTECYSSDLMLSLFRLNRGCKCTVVVNGVVVVNEIVIVRCTMGFLYRSITYPPPLSFCIPLISHLESPNTNVAAKSFIALSQFLNLLPPHSVETVLPPYSIKTYLSPYCCSTAKRISTPVNSVGPALVKLLNVYGSHTDAEKLRRTFGP